MPSASILDLAKASEGLSTLYGALLSAGFDDELSGSGPFTVFAPTNDAFAALPPGTLESLTPTQLEDILDYHIVNGTAIESSTLSAGMTAMTVEGSSLEITSVSPSVIINGESTVITADIMASNGIIHLIDSVLMPPPETPSVDPISEESEEDP